jgi:hypothetical protein
MNPLGLMDRFDALEIIVQAVRFQVPSTLYQRHRVNVVETESPGPFPSSILKYSD